MIKVLDFALWCLVGAAFFLVLMLAGLRFANAGTCYTTGGQDSWSRYTTCSDGSSAYTLQGPYSSYTTITPPPGREFNAPHYHEGPGYYDD